MITPVILCGGSGTRLWPLSRTSHPKQLLPLFDGKSLLQQTLLRINGIAEVNYPIVICNQEYRFIVAEQLREIGFEKAQIILEPIGKNTAPAVTIAALTAQSKGLNRHLLILPADHVITDHAAFAAAIMNATEVAKTGKLVTFGIMPTKPETGYGYIKKGEALAATAFQAKQFVEKPDLATAESYLASGDYFWNSGMFMFKADAYLREVEKYAPEILTACQSCVENMNMDLDFYRISADIFATCQNESIDYAIMEKSDNIAIVPLAANWSDVGSWTAMWDINAMDSSGNVIRGDIITDQVHNSYLHAESRLLAVVGVSDLAIVETADAVLVTHKNSCQDVKLLVNTMKKNNRSEVERHSREYRPWGYFETLNTGNSFKVKHLMVKPGGKLSLQTHQFRSEHWIVIKGVASVTSGKQLFELNENQSTFIPANTKHRLENKTQTPLNLIEVQTGTYFGEDDIVRFEDIYQRDVTLEFEPA